MANLLESDLVFGRFPEWGRFATISRRPDGKGCVVDFNVACPSQRVDYGLWVSTAADELTIGFDTYHCHFTDYENPLNQEQITAGLQFAANIIDERVGVVSWYQADKFVGSRLVELPYAPSLPRLLNNLGGTAELVGIGADCDRVTLRSWFGRFDRDESCTSANIADELSQESSAQPRGMLIIPPDQP
jgi:hypothetical protein